MKRRWFQFSLRTAIVAMVVVTVGIGIYIRWPYYRAGQVLDHANGDKSFRAWPAVREALINNDSFRNSVFESDYDHPLDILREGNGQIQIWRMRLSDYVMWNVYLDRETGIPTGEVECQTYRQTPLK